MKILMLTYEVPILQPPTDHVPEYAPHLLQRTEFTDVVARDVLIHVRAD